VFVRIETRPRNHLPWATISIAVLVVGGFLLLESLDEAQRRIVLTRFGMTPGILSALWTSPQTGVFVKSITAAFASLVMHANWLHLLGNLVFLLIFGPPSERLLGPARVLVLFLVCGALANIAGALTLGASAAPIVGASGAVSSIVGAYLALFPRSHLGLVLPLGLFLEFVRVPTAWLIGVWAVVQVLFAWIDPSFGRVAWSIHIAGFIAGMAFALASRSGIARRQRN